MVVPGFFDLRQSCGQRIKMLLPVTIFSLVAIRVVALHFYLDREDVVLGAQAKEKVWIESFVGNMRLARLDRLLGIRK